MPIVKTNDLRRVPWRLRYRAGARLASEMRRLAIVATHQHCHVEFQGPVYIGPGFHLSIPDQGQLIIGPNVEFRRGFGCEIVGQGRITIGEGSIFTRDPYLQCTTSIDIGKGVGIGQACQIVDGSHRFRDWQEHWNRQGYNFRPLTIGDGAAIHSKCTIIADVGEGAVIGANAVVTKPIPPFCLAVGVPAKVIEYFGPPELRPPELDIERHA